MECAPWSLFASSAKSVCGDPSTASRARSVRGNVGCSTPRKQGACGGGDEEASGAGFAFVGGPGGRKEAPSKHARFADDAQAEEPNGACASRSRRMDAPSIVCPEQIRVRFDSSVSYDPHSPKHPDDQAQAELAGGESDLSKRPTVWTLRAEEFEFMWTRYHDEASPQILRQLSISHDGGLQADNLLKLWHTREEKFRRIVTAISSVGFALANMYYIIWIDTSVLLDPRADPDEDMFLLGKELWRAVEGDVLQIRRGLNSEKLVVLAELTLLVILLGRLCVLLYRAFRASKECFRWHCVAQLFWHWMPLFSTFSSMKLLHFVSPRVLFTELCLETVFLWERISHGYYFRAMWKISWFVLLRVLCLLVGFDAFLVKLRLTARFVEVKGFRLWFCIMGGVFMFQVLNIVNLSSYARKRLFVFIFGGEDGVVSTHEKAKEMTWNAMLAKRLREAFPLGEYLVIMLSLDDYDFQMLTLREVHRHTVRSSAVASLPPA